MHCMERTVLHRSGGVEKVRYIPACGEKRVPLRRRRGRHKGRGVRHRYGQPKE